MRRKLSAWVRAAVLVGIAGLCGCREAVMHNLTETEANKLLARLHSIEIDSRKVRQPDGKWQVEVPAGETLQALRYLEHSRMLRDAKLEPPAKVSLLSGRSELQSESARALSREVEATLTSVNGVLEARVHLQLPQRDPFVGAALPGGALGSASVLMITEEAFGLSREAVGALVSGAADIPAEKVAVILVKAGAEHKPIDQASLPAARKPYSALEVPGERAVGASSAYAGVRRVIRGLQGNPVQVAASLLILIIGVLSLWASRRQARKLQLRNIEGLFEQIK